MLAWGDVVMQMHCLEERWSTPHPDLEVASSRNGKNSLDTFVKNSLIFESRGKVCVLWLYFCYSIEAKRVESTKTGGDRSINGMFTCVLTALYVSKNQKKRKQRMKREVYGENKDRNIKKKVFVVFEIISKTK